jgi:hypothetical protein
MNLWSHFISQATKPSPIPTIDARLCPICKLYFEPKVRHQTICLSAACKKKRHAKDSIANYHKLKAKRNENPSQLR